MFYIPIIVISVFVIVFIIVTVTCICANANRESNTTIQLLETTTTQPYVMSTHRYQTTQVYTPPPPHDQVYYPPPQPPIYNQNIPCIKCGKEKPLSILVPCNHTCACMDCGLKLYNDRNPCPMCNTAIVSVWRHQ